MLFSILKKINFKGKIDIVDSRGLEHRYGSGEPYSKIRFINSSIQRKVFRNPSLYIGEGYMDGEIVIEEGTIEDFLNIVTSSYDDYLNNNPLFRIYEKFSGFFKSFQQINKIMKSKENVAHHYDLKEDLYRLFLDKDMQYSCAYFHNDNISLDQAQYDKKQHIINKLNISPEMSVLDIGCGWGGLCIQIAKETGAKVKGITLSENQYSTAKKKSLR